MKLLSIGVTGLLSVQVHHHPCNWEDPDAFIPVSASPADPIIFVMPKGGCRMNLQHACKFMDSLYPKLGL